MFPYTAQALGRAYQAIPRVPQDKRVGRAMQGQWDIQETEPGVFRVWNLENGHIHTVMYHDVGEGGAIWTCTCPDYEHRQRTCKHILAVFFRSGLVVADVDLAAGRSRVVPISLFGKGHKDNKGLPSQQLDTERSNMTTQNQQPAWMRQYSVDDGLAPLYPFIQWVNNGGTLEPRQATGGFASPVDQVQIGTYSYLHHRDGSYTEVTFAPALRVAVLRTRFSWTKDGVLLPSYVPGARGKLQALCLVVDTDNQIVGPVILTFTGMAGARFNAEYLRFAREVAKQTRRQAPAYAFFMTVQAGKVEVVGKGQQKSPITPPVWDGDFNPDRDFIGDEALDGLNWDEIKRWAEAWRKPRPNGDGVVTGTDEEEEEAYADEVDAFYEEESAAPAQPQRPAAQSQPQRPVAPAQPQRPAAQGQPQRPVAPAQPQRPATQGQPQRPAAPAQPQRPAAPAQPQRPAAQSQPTPRPAAQSQPQSLYGRYMPEEEEEIPF